MPSLAGRREPVSGALPALARQVTPQRSEIAMAAPSAPVRNLVRSTTSFRRSGNGISRWLAIFFSRSCIPVSSSVSAGLRDLGGVEILRRRVLNSAPGVAIEILCASSLWREQPRHLMRMITLCCRVRNGQLPSRRILFAHSPGHSFPWFSMLLSVNSRGLASDGT